MLPPNTLPSLFILAGLVGGCTAGVGGESRDPSFSRTDIATPADGVAFVDADGTVAATGASERIAADEPYYHPERLYAVVLVEEDDVLNVRAGAGTTHPIVQTLGPESVELTASGRQEMVGTQRWVEILLPGSRSGWVNSFYLTEMVPPASFCGDSQVQDLLVELEMALREQSGERLFGVVSPRHGLTVQVVPRGRLHRFDDTEARGLFSSRESIDWGTHPYTGEALRGSFADVVAPDLSAVVEHPNTSDTCNTMELGGHAYDATFPTELANFNYYSLHFAGTAEYSNMDWSTWIVGVEYSEGVPYVASLTHFAR